MATPWGSRASQAWASMARTYDINLVAKRVYSRLVFVGFESFDNNLRNFKIESLRA